MNLETLPEGSTIAATATSIVAGLIWLRRFLSREKVDLTKDLAEGHLIKTLQSERDKAMETAQQAWAVRTEDAKQIGTLMAKVEHLSAINANLVSSIEELKQEFALVKQELRQYRAIS